MAAPYDDGSSTESEYYFDPAEQEAPYELEAQIKQEPRTRQPNEESAAVEQDYTGHSPVREEIELPQGSEWSHAAVWDDAVERALAMASRFEREMVQPQREEERTADTSTSPVKKEAKTVRLKRKKQLKVKAKVVSLKSVKDTTPTVAATKPVVVVGLRRPPSTVTGAPTELERGLSVPRSTLWKAPGNQSWTSHGKTMQGSETEEKGFTPRQPTERKKSPSARGTELEKLSSSRRTEQSNPLDKLFSNRRSEHSKLTHSLDKKRNRSPSRHRRTERSKSRPKDYSKRSQSRSPSRRQVEERRKRSKSRSPYRSTVSTSSRYRDTEEMSSPRHHSVSEKRSRHTHVRSRSPSRPSQSMHERRRSKSRSYSRERDRYDHHHEARHDHYDNSGRKSAPRDINKTDRDPRHPRHRESIYVAHGKQQSVEDAGRCRNRDNNTSANERASHKKKCLSARTEDQLGGHSTERSSAAVVLNRARSGSKPRLQLSEPLRSHRPTPDKSSSSTPLPNPSNVTKRTPTNPRIKSQKQKNAVPHTNTNSKKPACVYHDAFARRVFKLKLQEADVDEKTATGPLGDSDKWFYENRRRGMAAERARLMAQDLERFEKVYAASKVSKFELKRYQDDRDFAWRVVKFKRKQTSLQEQHMFISTEKKVELWRRLDQEREKLIAENGAMFHKVMMSQDQTEGTFKVREREAFSTNAGAPRRSGKRMHAKQLHKGQPKLCRQASGIPSTMQQPASANSRVVVGAALANSHNTLHSQPSKPWFLKG